MISVATGILVTRSASEKDLGNDITDQLLDQRKAPMVAGAVIMGFALIPALPKIPFLLIGGAFFAVGWSLRKLPTMREQEQLDSAAARTAAAQPQGELPTPRDAALDALALDPLELAIGFGLVPLVDKAGRRHAARARRDDPPPDRVRARHGHPGRAHPRRRRARLARVRHARARHRGRARRASWPATTWRWTRATRWAT